MKRASIPERIRKIVAQRSNYECEYCRVNEDDHFLSFQIDHIVSLKHGGSNEMNNLAWACPYCNQNKGSDIGTIIERSEALVPFFNPRKDHWKEHFHIENGEIIPLSEVGKATLKILKFNEPDILIFRQILFRAGRYNP